ncbi:LOW QUALITY PROTEIN: uncharacterized protein LOC130985105 [Salvia miltiorrhiza]|uniref:LOW QUALITY PROTEIN: uncharacterized protein LOC130985105 n=1 Tax=Salvia miltiorrhiza TaxID=226208 RepID=UPI0025AC8D05|nr:LOW QUALITY PROTEIN: uncharacterized protein LOC130985105 [Salvia miltiorrhiza]
MPFPWKKVKSTRISQLVNDHLHISQKRRDGSSLVVETGFPTSLIDLFIKNREKLKKPSKRRRQSPPIASPDDDVYDPVIEGSPLSCPPPPPPPSLAASPSPQRLSPIPPPPSNEILCCSRIGQRRRIRARLWRNSAAAAADGGGFDRDRDVNGVLIGVSKIFMVVVLALATKRLTVGITISAVLLLFLEYVGKHCGRLSKPPFAAAKGGIGARLLRFTKLEVKQEPSTRKPASLPSITCESSTPPAAAAEIQPEKDTAEERSDYQEIELVEMAMKREESISMSIPNSNSADCKVKSRRAKIKSKMKKIVPKKFRGAKKDHDLPIIDIAEESENGSVSSSVSDHREEEDGNSSIYSDLRLSDVIEEADTKIDDHGSGGGGGKIDAAAARRYMVLCLIVLAGLIGGRPFALALTLLWLLLLKLGQALSNTVSFSVKSG